MKFLLTTVSLLVAANASATSLMTAASCRAWVTTNNKSPVEIEVSQSASSFYSERIQGFQIGLQLNKDQSAVDLSNFVVKTKTGTTELNSGAYVQVREEDGYVGLEHILRLKSSKTAKQRNLVFSMACFLEK